MLILVANSKPTSLLTVNYEKLKMWPGTLKLLLVLKLTDLYRSCIFGSRRNPGIFLSNRKQECAHVCEGFFLWWLMVCILVLYATL
jgi:hypothetical protein